jgi:hypothetical protein
MSDPESAENDIRPGDNSIYAGDGTPWQVIYAGFMGLALCAFGLFGGIYLLNTRDELILRVGGIASIVLALGVGASCTALLTGARWSLLVCRIFALAALVGLAAGIVGEIFTWVRLSNRIKDTEMIESRLDKEKRVAAASQQADERAKLPEINAKYNENRAKWMQLNADMRNTRLLVFFLAVGGLLCGMTAGLLFRPAVGRYCTR